jgi:hypothetical protein
LKNRTAIHDTWLTPKDFYDKLNQRFHFDKFFDPCPPNYERLAGFDGLECRWPDRVYCNPPYSQLEKEAFVQKAVGEAKQDKLVVMLLPVSTSTKLFHDWILPYGKVEFLRGRLPFEGINSRGEWCNPGMGMSSLIAALPEVDFSAIKQVKNSGQHDSMVVIFGHA